MFTTLPRDMAYPHPLRLKTMAREKRILKLQNKQLKLGFTVAATNHLFF